MQPLGAENHQIRQYSLLSADHKNLPHIGKKRA
jgi:hypothetical protein